MWSERSHLQKVPTAFSTHCCCRGWTFRESDGWIGSTYKNSPHLVVHVTACNVFVCTKLSILCICLEFGCNEWNLQCNMLCGILFNVLFIFRSLYLMWYCIINIIITIKHSKHISIAIKGTDVPSQFTAQSKTDVHHMLQIMSWNHLNRHPSWQMVLL